MAGEIGKSLATLARVQSDKTVLLRTEESKLLEEQRTKDSAAMLSLLSALEVEVRAFNQDRGNLDEISISPTSIFLARRLVGPVTVEFSITDNMLEITSPGRERPDSFMVIPDGSEVLYARPGRGKPSDQTICSQDSIVGGIMKLALNLKG